MGFSWRKSIKLGKNLRLNLSSGSGLGLSFGIKNARASVNKNGVRLSGGMGGLSLTKHFSFKKIFKFFK